MRLPGAGDDDRHVVGGRRTVLFLIAFLNVALSFVVWSPVAMNGGFYGDDMDLLAGQLKGTSLATFAQALTQTDGLHYRPVTSALHVAAFKAFGTNFDGYVILNMILFGLCGLLVAIIVLDLDRAPVWLAAALGTATVVSRFGYYHVSQRHGLMEIAAVAELLLMVRYGIRAFSSRAKRDLWWALVWFVALVFTHERFLALLPVIVLLPWLVPGRPVGRFLVGGVAVAGVLVNLGVKSWVFHLVVLRGTGGTTISFDPGRFGRLFSNALLNMVGFNAGEPYLSAFDFRDLGVVGFLPGLAGLAAVVAAGALWWRAETSGRGVKVRALVLLGACVVALSVSASVTVRQEYRWLLAPYVIVLCGWAAWWSRMGELRSRTRGPWLVTAFLVAGLVNDALYRTNFGDRVYLAAWKKSCRNMQAIGRTFAKEIRAKRTLNFVGGDMLVDVLSFYAGVEKAEVRLLDEKGLDELSREAIEDGLFFQYEAHDTWRFVSNQTLLAAWSPAARADGLSASELSKDPELLRRIRSENWWELLQAGNAVASGNPKLAETLFRRSISAMPGKDENPYPFLSLGKLLEGQGRTNEARDAYVSAERIAVAARLDVRPFTEALKDLESRHRF